MLCLRRHVSNSESSSPSASPLPSSSSPSQENPVLSRSTVKLISGLLSYNPVDRLEVASHLETYDLLLPVGDWNNLHNIEMPSIPQGWGRFYRQDFLRVTFFLAM
ncbi:unnamed protein product [Trichobilharzia regenti]|nr:unnamed protein product [Trichobilharzia regenti]